MQQIKYILFFLIISLKIEAQPSFEYSLINLEIKVLDNKNDVILFYKKADKLYSNLGYSVEFTKNRKINRYEKSSDESNIKIEIDNMSKGELVDIITNIFFQEDLVFNSNNFSNLSYYEINKFSRILNYFSSYKDCDQTVAQLFLKRLMSSHVLILGMGGTGSHLAHSLAASGIGELSIVDFDFCSTKKNAVNNPFKINANDNIPVIFWNRIFQKLYVLLPASTSTKKVIIVTTIYV